jgi:hypothetical protein
MSGDEVRADLLQRYPSKNDQGELIGKDPRNVALKILSRYYREKNPLKAIRARCLDCCCGQPSEVRKCVSVQCPAWPFRMGVNPFREKRELSPKQRRVMAARLHPARDGAHR